jgi:hypothetical protein
MAPKFQCNECDIKARFEGGARCEILRAEILNALILAIVSCRRIPVGCSSRAVDGGMAESTEGGLPGEAPKL